MRSIDRLSMLAALPLLLTACQTYEATYVGAPAVRQTYVVERGYDPYYAPRPVYRNRHDGAYEDEYRPRRLSREQSYGYERSYPAPVAQPRYGGRSLGPITVVPDTQGRPLVVPDGRVLPPGTRVYQGGSEQGGTGQ